MSATKRAKMPEPITLSGQDIVDLREYAEMAAIEWSGIMEDVPPATREAEAQFERITDLLRRLGIR